jgi:hypothetical protein
MAGEFAAMFWAYRRILPPDAGCAASLPVHERKTTHERALMN